MKNIKILISVPNYLVIRIDMATETYTFLGYHLPFQRNLLYQSNLFHLRIPFLVKNTIHRWSFLILTSMSFNSFSLHNLQLLLNILQRLLPRNLLIDIKRVLANSFDFSTALTLLKYSGLISYSIRYALYNSFEGLLDTDIHLALFLHFPDSNSIPDALQTGTLFNAKLHSNVPRKFFDDSNELC